MRLNNYQTFLEDRRTKRGDLLSDTTKKNYNAAVQQFLDYHDGEEVNNYKDFLYGINPPKKSKRNSFNFYALKLFWKSEHPRKSAEEFFKDVYRAPDKTKKTERMYLTFKQRQKVILNMPNLKNQVVGLIQLYTGVRVGDILRLKKMSDIGNRSTILLEEPEDNKKRLVFFFVGKGDKKYKVHIDKPDVVEIISNYLELEDDTEKKIDYLEPEHVEDNYWFMDFLKSPKGYYVKNNSADNIYKNNYNRYWVDLKIGLRSCNLDDTLYSTHCFRADFAKNVFDKYNDINLLKEVLNHSSIDTTARYLVNSGFERDRVLSEMYVEE